MVVKVDLQLILLVLSSISSRLNLFLVGICNSMYRFGVTCFFTGYDFSVDLASLVCH